MSRSRRPTQTDIARVAGVSPAVVSLVINGRTNGKIRISNDTQDRVRAAIRELGYVPNMAARQLAGGRNNLLGVFTYEPVFPLSKESFYYPFLIGIEQQAEALGFDLLLFTRATESTGRRQIYRDGINALQAADGAVLLGTYEDRDELARLHRDGYPFVYVGRRELDGTPPAYVGADYETITSQMVGHLVSLGHRDILYLAHQLTDNSESASDRVNGFHHGLREANLSTEGRYVSIASDPITASQIRAWLEGGTTAFITQTIRLAHHIQREAATLGLHAPRDFSIAALGNADPMIDDDGSVTSIHIPRIEMGAGAVELLVNMLYHPEVVTSRQVLLPCSITHGQSVGSPLRQS
jgi:DNA-binding LacI/PurR family transcriptional regulator